MTALPNHGLALPEGDHSWSPRYRPRHLDFALCNVAVRNDRPPGSRARTAGGRPFLVAGRLLIAHCPKKFEISQRWFSGLPILNGWYVTALSVGPLREPLTRFPALCSCPMPGGCAGIFLAWLLTRSLYCWNRLSANTFEDAPLCGNENFSEFLRH